MKKLMNGKRGFVFGIILGALIYFILQVVYNLVF